jgi:hypothetical protein
LERIKSFTNERALGVLHRPVFTQALPGEGEERWRAQSRLPPLVFASTFGLSRRGGLSPSGAGRRSAR